MSELSSFHHRFEPGNRLEAPPLLLLHGTGGDENDLIPLARMISPHSPLLSVRGQVLEHGMPRFFRRHAEGVFDEADVVRRAGELADFVKVASSHYGIGTPVALGYSNGANIAAAMLLLRPASLAGGVLMRAMVPLASPPQGNLANTPVLMLSGAQDPIVPRSNSDRLAAMLTERGASVDHRVVPVGHQLSQGDLTAAHQWLEGHNVAHQYAS